LTAACVSRANPLPRQRSAPNSIGSSRQSSRRRSAWWTTRYWRKRNARWQRHGRPGTRGPRLREQIAAVEDTLAVASEPVAVTLRSDGETAVTVYKVARLGQFQERALSLRPGTYTAVGARRGFRDERVEFTVTPRGLAEPVFIACTETI
jgi:hypothetical protein